MHTVSAGYLRAFAAASDRRKPHIWQFERAGGKEKLISVRNASVSRGIYTLWTEDGRPDTTIESSLLDTAVEAPFPAVVQVLSAGKTPKYGQWRDLSRFMAFQIARTPRSFQVFRDEVKRQRAEMGSNDPQLVMVYLAPFFEKWLCGMKWTLCRNHATLPLLTSDNPVVMWADRGEGAEI